MKKLLSLLATTILTAPVPMGLVACGNDEDAEATENFNVEELLAKAEKEIKLGFADFRRKKEKTDKDSNDLMNENMYKGYISTINSELKRLEVQNPQQTQQIESGIIKDQFLSQIQGDINDFIVKRLLNKAELKPLFRNINRNEILKIKDKSTKLVKLFFDWQNDVKDYGVPEYNFEEFNITMWYRIKAELKLDLSYNNRENKQVKKDISHDYIFSYSNGGAQINRLINLATENVTKKIENYILKVNFNSRNDDGNIIDAAGLQEKLKAKTGKYDISINNIETSSFKRLSNSSNSFKDICINNDFLHEALTQPSPSDATRYLEDQYLLPIVNEFKDSLETFIDNSKSRLDFNGVQKEKINDYGQVTITDWNISSLVLRPFDVTYIKIRTDQTQEQWAENVSTVIGETFHPESDFVKNHFDMVTDGNLTVTMNPEDFETAVSEKHTMSQISDYFNTKISKKAISSSFSKPIDVIMAGYHQTSPNPSLGDTKYFNKLDDGNTYVLPLEDKRHQPQLNPYNFVIIRYDNVEFYYGSSKNSNGKNVCFNKTIIKRGTDDFST